MSATSVESLHHLYLEDETDWLDRMARLIREGRHAELDYGHLAEFLTDMATRDRREVMSRLVVLIAHWLKWEHQPDRRSTSWRVTIMEQAHELELIFESRVLRNHAEEVHEKAYAQAVQRAMAETGLDRTHFPPAPPRAVEEWLLVDGLDRPVPSEAS